VEKRVRRGEEKSGVIGKRRDHKETIKNQNHGSSFTTITKGEDGRPSIFKGLRGGESKSPGAVLTGRYRFFPAPY